MAQPPDFGLPDEADTEENRRKVEQCVNELKDDDDVESEEQAIKICKNSILKSQALRGKGES